MNLKLSTISYGLSAGVLTFFALTYYYLQQKRKFQIIPNLKWEHIGSLKEIDFYPIKSSSALLLDEAECNEFGLKTCGFIDRRLIVLNEIDGKILSVGRYPLMLKIKSKICSEGVLSLSAINEDSIIVNLNDLKNQERPRIIKKMPGYSLNLKECFEGQHKWISRVILGKEHGLRLYLADDPIIERSWFGAVENDLIPVMVMHDKSVKELNSKVNSKEEVHHLQFRGNLLIQSFDDVQPFNEDSWLWLRIGEDPETCTILRYNSPCLRCIIPNIDIRTCERNKDCEPLRTMKSFRIRSHPAEPEMGIYFDVYKTGHLKCGDPIYVQYK